MSVTFDCCLDAERPLQVNARRGHGNIPGWVVAVIKQAVLLLGCLALHFALCPGSARGLVLLAHS